MVRSPVADVRCYHDKKILKILCCSVVLRIRDGLGRLCGLRPRTWGPKCLQTKRTAKIAKPEKTTNEQLPPQTTPLLTSCKTRCDFSPPSSNALPPLAPPANSHENDTFNPSFLALQTPSRPANPHFRHHIVPRLQIVPRTYGVRGSSSRGSRVSHANDVPRPALFPTSSMTAWPPLKYPGGVAGEEADYPGKRAGDWTG